MWHFNAANDNNTQYIPHVVYVAYTHDVNAMGANTLSKKCAQDSNPVYTWSLKYDDTVTQPNSAADIGQQARNNNGMGSMNNRHDAPIIGEGLCPHDNDDWRERRFWNVVDVNILCNVMVLSLLCVDGPSFDEYKGWLSSS